MGIAPMRERHQGSTRVLGDNPRMTDSAATVGSFPASREAIELRHLRSFVAVAEELNFGRAAERLYITQPALSRRIGALERLVGAELFRRSSRNVELTPAGEALLERARRLLSDVDDAVGVVKAVSGEIMARVVGLWQPMVDQIREEGDLDDQRTELEALLARIEMPAGTGVRPVNAGGVPALLVGANPDQAPGMLYLHGGGFVLASAFGYRPLAAALALASGSGVLVPDYRLAPEHPFPAAIDDAYAAYLWMLERTGSSRRLIVAGDSCGAGLALAVLLRARDDGMALPGGAALLSPVTDFRASSLVIDASDPTQVLLSRFWRGGVDAYLAGHPVDDPLVSPGLGDLSGLPPLLIQAAAADLFLSDSQALSERANEQGIPTELQLYPTDAHLFHLFWSFLPEAADAVDAVGDFVRARRATPDDAASE